MFLSKPTKNLFLLLGIFLACSFNYFQGYSGQLIFEIEFLNIIALYSVWLLLLLIFFNSFLFNKKWLKVILIFFFTLMIFLQILATNGRSDRRLVRRTTFSSQQVVSVYEYTTFGFHDSGKICRMAIRQRKVFTGVLQNKQLIHECTDLY